MNQNATKYVSLDGVMEEPGWTMLYWNDEIAKCKFDIKDNIAEEISKLKQQPGQDLFGCRK